MKLKHGVNLVVTQTQIDVLINLLGTLKYSATFAFLPKNNVEISFDMKNKFIISLDLSLTENVNLLDLFHRGIKYGVNFSSHDESNAISHKKTLKIMKRNGKKIIETSEGLQFYLDSIDPWIFIETFVLEIHNTNNLDNFNQKIIIDIGANTGDTPIFYANKGAKVYAFEPVKAHYDAMIKNIELNPSISYQIIPINAAVGRDGILKIYHSKKSDIAGDASIFYNTHGTDTEVSEVKGYSLNSIIKEFGLTHIDLLKMDCKGCEYEITSEILKNVDNVKIEYITFNDHKLEDITKILEENGFQYVIYLQNPHYVASLLKHGTIYASKLH